MITQVLAVLGAFVDTRHLIDVQIAAEADMIYRWPINYRQYASCRYPKITKSLYQACSDLNRLTPSRQTLIEVTEDHLRNFSPPVRNESSKAGEKPSMFVPRRRPDFGTIWGSCPVGDADPGDG